jgi:hypothetical protein
LCSIFHEQGKSNCQFFMWKPASNDVVVDVPTLVAGLRAPEESLLGVTNAATVLVSMLGA